MVQEGWTCPDFGHTETAELGTLPGEKIEKTVGEGRRAKVIETVVCPDCGSDRWASEMARLLVGTVEKAARDT